MKYRVYVLYSVSQIIEVTAESVEDAMEIGLGEVDSPNISNKFDMDGDPEVHAVYDEDDNEVWRAP